MSRTLGALLSALAQLRPLLLFALAALAVFTASRGLLIWAYFERLGGVDQLGAVFSRAWRFDLVVICAVCGLVILVEAFAPAFIIRGRVWRGVVVTWLCAWLMLIVFNEAATADFMTEFGVRPNRVYVEYLGSPLLILETLWAAHRPALLFGVALTAMSGIGAWLALHAAMRRRVMSHGLARFVVFVPLFILVSYGARGSFGHRPIAPSNAAFSTDAALNDLPLNSTYSSAHALTQMLNEREVITPYDELPRAEVMQRVRSGMQIAPELFADADLTTEHRLMPTVTATSSPNLVILLQEGLGAQYFASLGGEPVARKLEQWREKSFWFDWLYATGTRSARGIEAVVSGFLPTRARSVIKLEGAQKDFFTVARALRDQGYRTQFIYGGDSSFDNMRRFFLSNGFDEVIDWSDLVDDAVFKTTWGVSDEDLYARVHQEVSKRASDGQPFFTLVFSTSNHPPYDFPDGRIELYKQPRVGQQNAARYADYAVGSYLETAAQSGYWDNSLFMVVADHESRLTGEGLVPIFTFHIPAFIAGGPVEPRIVSRLASQTDLLPTVLSLMGIATTLPATGLDQSRTDLVGPGRAISQFADKFAYRWGDDVVILTPDNAPRQFTAGDGYLIEARLDTELLRDALAHSGLPLLAYQEQWYH